MRPRRALALLSVLLLASAAQAQEGVAEPPAAASQPAPASATPTTQPLAPADKDEKDLWSESRDYEQSIRRSGLIVKEKAVTAYLQSVMQRLFPEYKESFKVAIIDAPDYNAFALPTGAVYVTSGLLSRFENEAQLATVLAHEGSHALKRHGMRQRESAHVVGALMLGAVLAGPLGQLASAAVGVSAMSGFSRDHEREADREGFARMVRAGYRPDEAARIFDLLAEEVKLSGKDTPSLMFASHPKLKERTESYQEQTAAMGEQAKQGQVGESEFLAVVGPLREQGLARDLAAGRYGNIIKRLESPGVLAHLPPHAMYYKAEAYRLRRGEGDTESALGCYRAAREANPDYAPVLRGMAEALLRKGDKAEALKLFRDYLQANPDASDRSFVEEAIESITQGNTPT